MRLLIIFLFSLTVLTACGPTRESSQQAQVDPEENARLLMQSGDYATAAVEYLDLAAKDKQNSAVYRLKAAAAYVEAGQYSAAERILSETSVPKNDSLQNLRMRILSARLELEFGQPGKALSQLQKIPESEITQGLRMTYHDILARAYLAHGDYLKAASERLRLVSYLNTQTEIEQNNRSLWKIFEAIPEADLDDLRIVAPDELTSWFELASIYQTYRYQPARLKIAIDGWIQRYPGHPAYSTIAPQLISTSDQFVQRPSKIGLLLPFSGQYQKSSIAIRDGFLAAWYLDKQEKSQIEIYDANALNIVAVYQQAVGDGVDYVVGPLEKVAINQLADQGELPVQVLALNRQDLKSEQDINKKLIQFGLSPEDEAIQVADTAMADGHRLALVITPNIPWGNRIADAFKNRWIELGGGILEHTHFQSNSKDFASPVKDLLNINSSEQRGRDLRNKLNIKINNVERRRQDADFIFTAAVPTDARQLFPQLRFHHAGDLLVYSTSHIFTGIVDSTKDSDLEGVMFIDMPWILDTTRQLSIIQDALNRNWSQEKSQYRRLYALGIDAYHLIPEIGRLSAEKNGYLEGETGELTLSPDNIVKRKLRRAQFIKGEPVLLN
ncbi:MAG: penicillin-binding protein activator [Proteobacteria bacterium]|nr:penicillin-binding protein activator [Pseudomonadota bacterium]